MFKEHLFMARSTRPGVAKAQNHCVRTMKQQEKHAEPLARASLLPS
jgi:hypothetical protein